MAGDSPDSPVTTSVVRCNPKDTAEWLKTVFTVKDAKVLVAGKDRGKYQEARLPLARPTEVQFDQSRIIADQQGLYPMIIGPTDDGFRFSIYTPFYAFLDEIIESDGLPGYAPHPKDKGITRKGFREICESLHHHYTASVGSKPECYRVQDSLGYPSEHYIWAVGESFIILTAYNGNDSDGIHMTITSDPKSADSIRKMPLTTRDVFQDWGAPMPSSPKKITK